MTLSINSMAFDLMNALQDSLGSPGDAGAWPQSRRECAQRLLADLGQLLAEDVPAGGTPCGEAGDAAAQGDATATEVASELIAAAKPDKADLAVLRQQAQRLLSRIENDYAWNDRQLSEHISDFRMMLKGDEAWVAQQLKGAKSRGLARRAEEDSLKQLLTRHSVCGAELRSYWSDLNGRAGFFIKSAIKTIKWKLRKEMESEHGRGGSKAVLALFQKAKGIYGKYLNDFVIPEEWTSDQGGDEPDPLPEGPSHALYDMPKANVFNVYIDETGQSFSADDGSSGTAGKMVAVVFNADATPVIGSFHATESTPGQIRAKLAELLKSKAGILGLTCASLGIEGDRGWLQALRDTIKWVWRLLPTREGATINLKVHVEQRANFKPELRTELSVELLMADLTSENAQRAREIRVSSLEFCSKDDPCVPWADLVACLWGSPGKENRHTLAESGLRDSCLCSYPAEILEGCRLALSGQPMTPRQWTALMRLSPRPGTLPRLALEALGRLCEGDPTLWKRYAEAMQAYLEGKEYLHEVLEEMSKWLRPMGGADPVAEFYFQSAELARLNHLGDVASADLKSTREALASLTPKVAALDSNAELRVALRLAVTDSNAFDFAGAEARLARWNPQAGGQLTGSAIWDGKILSSLGQYRAFQRDPVGGTYLLRQALERFDSVATIDPGEAMRQGSQTSTYLATALMDSRSAKREEIEAAMVRALGCPIAAAIKRLVQHPLERNSYPHWLLLRYLCTLGTDEERGQYLKGCHKWAGERLGSTHPWPQIQYYRYLLAADNPDLRREVRNTLARVRGKDNMPTVGLIVAAIAVSMGIFDPASEPVRALLLQLGGWMPCAEPIVDELKVARPGDDPNLARRLIPFIFC